jgi:hypothetical protein
MSVPGNVLNIDKLLGKTKQRIYKVGIELEGLWTKLPEGTIPIRDGSVSVARPANLPLSVPHHIGEIPSEILEPDQITTWIKTFYPQHVNATCGLHIHQSFKRALYYQWLMTPDYTATMVEYVKRWAKELSLPKDHPIWSRLKGENQFCKHEFVADLQVLKKSKSYDHAVPGSRYTTINYCHGLHTTVECRLLPMMETVEEAISAVKNVLNITNACLVVISRNEEKQKITLDQTSNDALVESKKVMLHREEVWDEY